MWLNSGGDTTTKLLSATTKPIRTHRFLIVSLSIIGWIVGSVLLVYGAFFLLILYLGGGFYANSAQRSLQPLVALMKQRGAQQFCANGDTGHSIDNTTPWYQSYYSVADSPDLVTTIENTMAPKGFSLHTDTDTIKQLQTGSAAAGAQTYDPAGSYLAAHNDASGADLTVVVNRKVSIVLNCTSDNYVFGQTIPASPGRDLVFISMDYPSTQ